MTCLQSIWKSHYVVQSNWSCHIEHQASRRNIAGGLDYMTIQASWSRGIMIHVHGMPGNQDTCTTMFDVEVWNNHLILSIVSVFVSYFDRSRLKQLELYVYAYELKYCVERSRLPSRQERWPMQESIRGQYWVNYQVKRSISGTKTTIFVRFHLNKYSRVQYKTSGGAF